MTKPKTDAIGGGATPASLLARTNANPLMVEPASAVDTGSNHVMVRERGTPQSAGVGAGAPSGSSGSAPVTAHPLSDHTISSRNRDYRAQFYDATNIGGLNDPAPRDAAGGIVLEQRTVPEKGEGMAGGGLALPSRDSPEDGGGIPSLCGL